MADLTVSADIDTLLSAANNAGIRAALGTGTASGSTYLRGDGTWSTPSGGGDLVGPASSTDNTIPRFDSTTGKLLQGSTATVSDGGTMTVAPTTSIQRLGYTVNWPSETTCRPLQITPWAADHGDWRIDLQLHSNTGGTGYDFTSWIGVIGDGTTTEINYQCRETSYDPGGTYKSHEIYDVIQHVNATYWPTSRRMGYTYSTFSTGSTMGWIDMDIVYLRSSNPNPDNPGVGSLGVYAYWEPDKTTGNTTHRLNYRNGTNYIQHTISATLGKIECGNLTLEANGAGSLIMGLSGGAASITLNGSTVSVVGTLAATKAKISHVASAAITALETGGLKLIDAASHSGIWCYNGQTVIIGASENAEFGVDGYYHQTKVRSDAMLGFASTTALSSLVDTGFKRGAAGRVDVVDGSSVLADLRCAKIHTGTHSAIGAETITGYLTIKDSAGNDRKIAVVS